MQVIRSIAIGATLLAVAAALSAGEPRLTVDQDGLKAYWQRSGSEGKATPLYPRDAMRAAASGCVSIAYGIDSAGKVVEPRVLQSYITKKDGDEMRQHMEHSVLGNLVTWRYAPAPENQQRRPVYTYATVTLAIDSGLNSKAFKDEVESHCKVVDFIAPVADARGSTLENQSP